MNIVEEAGWSAARRLLEIIAERAVSIWRSSEVSSNWIPRINNHFCGEVTVFCQNTVVPQIHVDGVYRLTDDQKEVAKKERRLLKSKKRPNDPHAILVGELYWASDPPQCRVQTLDFSDVCALRISNLKPEILSSSAVIVCRESEVILLHRRADDVATFPGHIHTLGGAYIPPGVRGVDADRAGLRSTAHREIHEEAQLALPGDDFPPMMIAKELSTGFIQLVFLGFGVTPITLKEIKGNWEGQPLRLPFERLPAFLLEQNHQWVPSGKAHILAWLALGAPNAGSSPRFGRLSPSQLFDAVVGV